MKRIKDKEINLYRKACINYLLKNINRFTITIDLLIDTCLREVSDLPPKPYYASVYTNLVGRQSIDQQRKISLSLIKQRLNLKYGEQMYYIVDIKLDEVVRILNKLPKKPLDSDPYIGLFKISNTLINDLQNNKYNMPTYYNHVTDSTLEMMMKYEGYVPCVYKDPGSNDGKPYTGGHGSVKLKVGGYNYNTLPLGECFTKEIWDLQFKQDVIIFENDIKQYVLVPITQNMYNALTSLIYNIGLTLFLSSTCYKRLSNKDYKGAAEALTWFNKGGNGKVLLGLVKRRTEEKELFLKDL